MKVLMLCEFFAEELDYQEALLAKYYHKLGCEVVVITSAARSVQAYIDGTEGAGQYSLQQGEYAKVYRVPTIVRLFRRIRVFSSIRRIVDAEQPDLIIFHDIIPNMLEARRYLRDHPSVCAILDYHADYSNSGATRLSRLLLHKWSRRLILGRLRSRLSAILPVVPASQDFLHDLYGIRREETELFPLGVDLDMATSVAHSSARAEMRAKLVIPADALVVFTGGKLVPLKQTELVIDAVAAMHDAAVHLIVVGSAADPAYEKVLRRRAAGANVHFVGWQDRLGVYRYQAAADVAVFPTSQSVLWQQSIGMGLPLVVSEGVGAIRVRQDVGYLNRANNVMILDRHADVTPQITEFLQRCRRDPSLLAAMAKGAAEVAYNYLSYERLARRTLEIAQHHRLMQDR